MSGLAVRSSELFGSLPSASFVAVRCTVYVVRTYVENCKRRLKRRPSARPYDLLLSITGASSLKGS